MNKKKIGLTFLMSISLMLFSGCKNKEDNISNEVTNNSSNNDNSSNDTTGNDNPTDPNKDENPGNENPSTEEEKYDEKEDSIEGIDVSDLSNLIAASEKISSTYTISYRHYFNQAANDYYRINYGNELENGTYTYDGVETDSFNFVKFNSEYISKNTFTRISENKYQCETKEVINEFVKAVIPNYKNEGYYMTFSRITIELDSNANMERIRVYTKTTQIGKLVESHTDKIKTNWYLLFAECLFVY